jgi:iron complex outermembrane recepter protein
VMWDVVPGRQHLWGAISKAVRTPSLTELSIRTNFASFIGPQGVPVMLGLIGNPDYETETFVNAEAGYRVQLGSWGAVDVTIFRGDYDGLPTREPVAPVFETRPAPAHLFIASRNENLLEVKTTGIEAHLELMPADGWQIEASYSGFSFDPRPDATSRDPDAAGFDANAPRHQWQVRGSYLAGSRVELSAALFHVGRLQVLEIPAYTRADARVEVTLGRGLSVSATGHNLFDDAHLEFVVPQLASTQVRRSVHLRLGWRF